MRHGNDDDDVMYLTFKRATLIRSDVGQLPRCLRGRKLGQKGTTEVPELYPNPSSPCSGPPCSDHDDGSPVFSKFWGPPNLQHPRYQDWTAACTCTFRAHLCTVRARAHISLSLIPSSAARIVVLASWLRVGGFSLETGLVTSCGRHMSPKELLNGVR